MFPGVKANSREIARLLGWEVTSASSPKIHNPITGDTYADSPKGLGRFIEDAWPHVLEATKPSAPDTPPWEITISSRPNAFRSDGSMVYTASAERQRPERPGTPFQHKVSQSESSGFEDTNYGERQKAHGRGNYEYEARINLAYELLTHAKIQTIPGQPGVFRAERVIF